MGATYVEEVLDKCDVRRAFDQASHVPIAGTPAVAMLNEQLQADLMFLDDIIALHSTDVAPKYSPLIPARPKNPRRGMGRLP